MAKYIWTHGDEQYEYLADGEMLALVTRLGHGWEIHYRTSPDQQLRFGGISPTLERAQHNAVGLARGW